MTRDGMISWVNTMINEMCAFKYLYGKRDDVASRLTEEFCDALGVMLNYLTEEQTNG